ncbi:MAG: hypothetical protein ACK4M6_02650 [Hyphomonas sp.]
MKLLTRQLTPSTQMPTTSPDASARLSSAPDQSRRKTLILFAYFVVLRTISDRLKLPYGAWPDLKGVRNILIYIDYFSNARRHTNKYTNKPSGQGH